MVNKMVFSDELDKSLYMILENDDNNRKLVCDFISHHFCATRHQFEVLDL